MYSIRPFKSQDSISASLPSTFVDLSRSQSSDNRSISSFKDIGSDSSSTIGCSEACADGDGRVDGDGKFDGDAKVDGDGVGGLPPVHPVSVVSIITAKMEIATVFFKCNAPSLFVTVQGVS